MSGFNESQSTTQRVCLLGRKEADLGEVMADTQAAMQWAVNKAPWSQWHDE